MWSRCPDLRPLQPPSLGLLFENWGIAISPHRRRRGVQSSVDLAAVKDGGPAGSIPGCLQVEFIQHNIHLFIKCPNSSGNQSNCSYVPLTEGPFWDFQVNLTVRGPAWTKVSAWSVTLIWWNPLVDYSHWSDWWKDAVNGFSPFSPQICISPKPAECESPDSIKIPYFLFQSKTWHQTSLDSYSLITGKSRRQCSSRKEKLGGRLKEQAIAIDGTSLSCVIAAVKDGSAGKRRCEKVNSPAVIVTTAQSAGQKGSSRKEGDPSEVSHTNCGRASDHNNAG